MFTIVMNEITINELLDKVNACNQDNQQAHNTENL